MMNKALKNKWIKALRSGKFKQYRGRLSGKLPGDYKGYCCLGVLAVVNGASRQTIDKKATYGKSCGLTSEAVESLTNMNDCRSFSFKRIARYLQRSKTI